MKLLLTAATAALMASETLQTEAFLSSEIRSLDDTPFHSLHAEIPPDAVADAVADTSASASTHVNTTEKNNFYAKSIVMTEAETRRRAQEDNPFDLFRPLTCNDNLPDECSTEFSDLPNGGRVVPCGLCVTMNLENNVSLPNGLDIRGKLVFPPNHKVTITTPFVFVQGLLQVSNTLPIAPENVGVKFILTGSEDLYLEPHNENAVGCESYETGKCPVGSKPFVIAGGRVNVNGMPDTCPSWTTIIDVETADVIPEYFPQPVTPPDGCPRALSDVNFESGPGMWRSHLGSIRERLEEGSNSFLRVTDRTRDYMGPKLDLSELRTCIDDESDYVFSARIRLTKPEGGATDCSSAGINCPSLKTYYKKLDNKEYMYIKRSMRVEEGIETTDGEWFDLTGRFRFNSNEVSDDGVYVVFAIAGVEPGSVIDVDDVYIGLPPEDTYPNVDSPEAICDNLFLADGSADGYSNPPKYPYPLYNNGGSKTPVRVITETETLEDGTQVANNFYRLAGRTQEYESLNFDLIPDCIRPMAQYEVFFRARINHPGTFRKVRVYFYHSSSSFIVSKECPPMGGGRGWVTCIVGITVNNAAAAADSIYFRINTGWPETGGSTDVTVDMDYDDLSVKLKHGPVTGLVVDSSAKQCWGTGSEVLITSHTASWEGEQLGVIGGVSASSADGRVTISLTDPIVRPTTAVDDPNAATEVALLSRNILLEAADDNEDNGGVLTVLNTVGEAQKLNGVEIKNFGQKGKKDRYAVQFQYCASVDGTVISKNVIRDSKYRCIVIKGTHDADIIDNVAYNTKGHCYVLEDGKEKGNRFEHNLGARTNDSGDKSSSTFWIRSVENSFVGNVAAGSRRRGFTFALPSSIQDKSKNLPGPNNSPRSQLMTEFSNNAAHSNDDYGLLVDKWYAPQESVLRNLRSYRNDNDGIYLRGWNLALEGAYVADNRVQNVNHKYCDSCRISDSLIVGLSDTFKSQVIAQDIWHTCWDEDLSNRLIGLQIMQYTDKIPYPGLNLTNVHFSGFENSGCVRPSHIAFDYSRRIPHYDVLTQFKGITKSDSTFLPDLCSAEKLGVEDVLFTDLDSSLHPSGPESFIGSSVIVSTRSFMKGFAGGECFDVAEMCYSYCENSCLRFVNFSVDAYETENVTLVVTDLASSKAIEMGGNWRCDMSGGEPNIYYNTFNSDLRIFSAPLPTGNFEAKFMKDGQEAWPTFVEMTYESDPQCGGVQEGSVRMKEPPSVSEDDCAELVRNGDGEMQNGNYTHWYHISGGVLNEAGSGVGSSTAIVSTDRDNEYDGLAFYLDTRCLKKMVGREYELTAMFHAELDGTGLDCNPDDNNNVNGCPRFTAQMRTWDPEGNEFTTSTWYELAKSTRPYHKDDYNLAHGTFVISENMAAADSVLIYFSRTSDYAKLLLDNVSIHPLQSSTRTSDGCLNDFIINGNMEDDSSTTKYWDIRSYYDGHITLIPGGADGVGNAIQVVGRTHANQGPLQWINPTCFVAGQEYEIYLRFKLSKGESDTTCDPAAKYGEVGACPLAYIYAQAPEILPGPNDDEVWTKIGEVADLGSNAQWGVIRGYFTADEILLNAFRAYVYFVGVEPNVDIAIDDVSIIPFSLDCTNLVDNGDAEIGNARHWWAEGDSTVTVIDGGANGSSKALASRGRNERGWGMEQAFQMDCVVERDQYILEAMVKLEKNGNAFSCNPNIVQGTNSCPLAAIVSKHNDVVRVRDVAAVVGSADAQGWFHLRGIFQFFEYDQSSDIVLVRFRDAPVGTDIIVDDVVISKVDPPI